MGEGFELTTNRKSADRASEIKESLRRGRTDLLWINRKLLEIGERYD